MARHRAQDGGRQGRRLLPLQRRLRGEDAAREGEYRCLIRCRPSGTLSVMIAASLSLKARMYFLSTALAFAEIVPRLMAIFANAVTTKRRNTKPATNADRRAEWPIGLKSELVIFWRQLSLMVLNAACDASISMEIMRIINAKLLALTY